jgi:CheY-like chemotaxis protein
LLAFRAENVALGTHQDPPLPPGDYVRLSIADRGGGITKELLSRVFDPYYSTKRRGEQKGMGLGLTICHTIIQKHGGGIAVESKPAVGTTFHVYLPAGRKWSEEAEAPDATPGPRRGRMLVMEEEDGVREVVQVWLQRLGHEVDLVADGGQAVAAWLRARQSGCPYDVALLDLTVRGGIGGQEVVQSLLQIDPTTKAIVMSGYPDDPVVLAPERHGFQGVLVKPFGSETLRKVLARVLGPGGPGGSDQ